MTAEQAKGKYVECFGGFPEFLFMAANDNEIIKAVEMVLKTGEEIEPPYDDADY